MLLWLFIFANEYTPIVSSSTQGQTLQTMLTTPITTLAGSMNIGVGSQDGDAEMYDNGTINTSDERLKKDIQDSDLGLDFINKLRPVSYKFKKDKQDKKLKYGIILYNTISKT